MTTQLYCLCGRRTPIGPRQIQATLVCEGCGKTLQFHGKGDGQTRWLVIGGSNKPPRLAVPIPIGVPLSIGASAGEWLTLPGDGVDDHHVELTLQEDFRLRVKHIGAAGATWINRARIAEGVLREEDALVIGPYKLVLRRGSSLGAEGAAQSPVVIVEDEPADVGDSEPVDEPSEYAELPPEERPPRQILRWTISIAVLLGALGYLSWWWFAPRFSKYMPSDTVYHCPVDGTTIRDDWRSGPPKCPHCGALCLGVLKYKPEKTQPAEITTSAPTTQPVGKRVNN